MIETNAAISYDTAAATTTNAAILYGIAATTTQCYRQQHQQQQKIAIELILK